MEIEENLEENLEENINEEDENREEEGDKELFREVEEKSIEETKLNSQQFLALTQVRI